ncbi:hypothetical protein MPLA_750129 [Mesorhizobium sp. ORS 3359]|nr:hypothetical protein MPLA_750129 [Mesorhizobium sp. ORS 3359]
MEISKLDVPSGYADDLLLELSIAGRATITQIQRVNKGALPAGRYTGRARRTNAPVVGQQDSGGRTDLVTACDRSLKHALESDGFKFSSFGRLGVKCTINPSSPMGHQWATSSNASLTSNVWSVGKFIPGTTTLVTRDGVEAGARFRQRSVHIPFSAFSAR